MKLNESIQTQWEMILQIAQRHGVGQVRVFGSVARGETTENSDLDLLIDVTGPTPPWFPGGLVAELEALLDRRVDVVETDALRKELRDRVLQ
jgi:predicted nucleotidyltransferase